MFIILYHEVKMIGMTREKRDAKLKFRLYKPLNSVYDENGAKVFVPN